MSLTLSKSEDRIKRYKDRAGGARKLARRMMVLLVGASLFAIWQDKDLAPEIHAMMQAGVSYAAGIAENSESLKATIDALG